MKNVHGLHAVLLAFSLLLAGAGAARAQSQSLNVTVTGSVDPVIAPISILPDNPDNPNTTVFFDFHASVSNPPVATQPGEVINPPTAAWTFEVQYKAALTDDFQTADPATYSLRSESSPFAVDDTMGYWFYVAGYWRVVGSAGVTYTGTLSVSATPIGISTLPIGSDPVGGVVVSLFGMEPQDGISETPAPILFGESWYGFNFGIAGVHDAVAVDKVQYQTTDNSVSPPVTSWTDVPSTLYVLKGTTVTFQALPLAHDTNFPPNKPVWGGTADGASGTGATKTVTFNTTSNNLLDFRTVTVECGNTITFEVIVYDIIPNPIPVDNFDNRDFGTYGVGEDVNLSYVIYPFDVGIYDAIGWLPPLGANSVIDGGKLYVGDVNQTGSVTMTLAVLSGPSQGQTRTVTKAVTAPTSATLVIDTMQKDPMQNDIPHIHMVDTISAGFTAHTYLHPNTVSFHNCLYQETNEQVTQATGVFAGGIGIWHDHNLDFTPHEPDKVPFSTGNVVTGCRSMEIDTNAITAGSPAGAGTLILPIPWNYYVPIHFSQGKYTGPTVFTTVTFSVVSNANGTCILTKAGASSTSYYGDPTSP